MRLLLLIIFLNGIAYAQIDSTNIDIENFINNDDDIDNELIELIDFYQNNPININKSSKEELQDLPFITTSFINDIIFYRKKVGKIFSVNELYIVEEIDKETLDKVIGLLTVKEEVSVDKVINYNIRSRVYKELDYEDDKNFIGNNYKVYNRLIGNYNNTSLSILTEKDAGESSLINHYSFSIQHKLINFPIKEAIIGDFNIGFGQGLSLWNMYGNSKSSEVLLITKSQKFLKQFRSTNETNYFRGISINFSPFNDISIYPFYSNKLVDANIVNNEISSFYNAGYFRTDNEINKQDAIREKIFGSVINYSPTNSFDISFLYYQINFNKRLSEERFANYSEDNYSFSINYNVNNLSISNEFALNKFSNSFISVIKYKAAKSLYFSISYRNYGEIYNSFYNNSFGENRYANNESGIYFSSSYRFKNFHINLYLDQYKNGVNEKNLLPNVGLDFLVKFNWKINHNSNLTLLYKHESKEKIYKTNLLPNIEKENKSKLRIDFVHKINKQIKLKTRLEKSFAKEPDAKEIGFLIYQDFKYSLKNLQFYSRITFYKTDSYFSRLYEFENDLSGVFSNLPLYGNGVKWYMVFKYLILDGVKLSIKYRDHYKSMYDEIIHNKLINSKIDKKIGIQIDFRKNL